MFGVNIKAKVSSKLCQETGDFGILYVKGIYVLDYTETT